MDQDQAAQSAIRKAAFRLLPFLCLCYTVNFLDRVNVGFAALAMNQDLGFSPSVFGAGAGIFFIGYLLFEIPSNLALQHFGARIWIARIMVSWGLVAAAMAFVGGTASFYAMRFLLGVAEAGFFRYHALGDALTKPRVLTLALLYFCIVVGLCGIGFWMPQVIQAFGLTPLKIGFLTAVPYLFASIAMVIWGWHSDQTGERIWHVALPLFLAGGAFAWSAQSGPLGLTMVALTVATVGIYAAIGTFWSLPTSILTGTGAAAGLALVNSVGNLGGLAGPSIVGVMKQATGTFTSGLLFLAAALVLGGAVALLFGYTQRTRTTASSSA
jgi:nitrate/nitrite transporter NarK